MKYIPSQKPGVVPGGAGPSLVSRREGGLSWVYACGCHQRLFGGKKPLWGEIQADSRAQLVKSNPLRQVYKVNLEGWEIYVKVYK